MTAIRQVALHWTPVQLGATVMCIYIYIYIYLCRDMYLYTYIYLTSTTLTRRTDDKGRVQRLEQPEPNLQTPTKRLRPWHQADPERTPHYNHAKPVTAAARDSPCS